MASFYAALGDLQVTAARLTWGAWGLPVADVTLATDDVLPASPLTLVVGTLALVMTPAPRPDGSFAGTRFVRLVGGRGGWRTNVAPRFYNDTNGVKLGAVLRDLAADCGEAITVGTDRVIGTQWARSAGPASRALSALVGRSGWWLDNLGITHTGDRPSVQVVSDFLPSDYAPSHGLVTIATEDPGAWIPGAIFEHPLLPGILTAASVTTTLTPRGVLRLEVMTS